MMSYVALLEIGVLFPRLKSLMSLAMIMFNILVLLANKKHRGIVLLSSFLLGGEIFPIINVFVTIIMSGRYLVLHKPQKAHLLFFMFITITSFVNSLANSTTINVIFYLAYLAMLYFCVLFSIGKIDADDLTYSIKNFIIIQFIADVLIGFTNGIFSPGDLFMGTLGNAHWLGNWILVNITVFLYAQKYLSGKKWLKICKDNLLILLMGLTILYLADAKVLILAMLVGIMFYWFFERLFRRKNSFFCCFICFYIALFLFSYLFEWSIIKNFIMLLSPAYSIYLYSNGWNGKFLYITGTFTKQLRGLHLFTGYGLGQYGSRVANMFAYNVMWRGDNAINRIIANNFAPSYLTNYAQYIRYYSADFVEGIRWRSAILSYPFNSITALIGETGIFGILGFAKITEYYIKDSACRFLAFYFMVACMFDIYFDNFPCVVLIIVMLMNTKFTAKNQQVPFQEAISENSK